MEKFEALADLIRTLSKRCEQFEQYKENSDTYYRWYKEEKDRTSKANDEIDRLRTILDNAGIEY